MTSIRRLTLFLVPVALLTMLMIFVSISSISTNIVERWVRVLVEQQTQSTLKLGFGPISDEIAKVTSQAGSPELLALAIDPSNPLASASGIEYLNSARRHLTDQSFFLALKRNNGYYLNDSVGTFDGKELQAHLSPADPADSWFYATLNASSDLNLNPNYDKIIQATKLWINKQIRHPVTGEVLGVYGTGLPLDDFTDRFLTMETQGFSSLFIDRTGNVTLSANEDEIVLNTVGESGEQTSLFNTLDSESDVLNLRQALEESKLRPETVSITQVNWLKREYLVGAVYIPIVDWYQLTLVDVETISPISDFNPIFISIFAAFLILLASFIFGFRRYLLRPINVLKHRISTFTESREIESSTVVLPADFAEVEQAFIRLTDRVTEKERSLEATIRKRTQQLIHSEKSALLTRIAGGVAHEINNPMGVVTSNISLLGEYLTTIKPYLHNQLAQLKETDESALLNAKAIQELEFILEDADEIITDAANGCRRVKSLVSSLREYAHDGDVSIEFFSLNEVVEMAITLVKDKVPEHMEVQLVLEKQLPEIEMDVKAITEIILGVVENALFAVSAVSSPKLLISTTYDAQSVYVDIEDNGKGIEPNDMTRLFDPFFTTRDIGDGTGLTLAIARVVMNSHGGDILAFSDGVNTGARFRLQFNWLD